jgi:hypothetical protein
VPVTHLSAPKARIDVSLEGVSFTRTKSDAQRRGARPRVHVSWDDVEGADVQVTRKGRVVLLVAVAGAAPVEHHRYDPYALKVPRAQSDLAHALVGQINDEVATRRRWRETAAEG